MRIHWSHTVRPFMVKFQLGTGTVAITAHAWCSTFRCRLINQHRLNQYWLDVGLYDKGWHPIQLLTMQSVRKLRQEWVPFVVYQQVARLKPNILLRFISLDLRRGYHSCGAHQQRGWLPELPNTHHVSRSGSHSSWHEKDLVTIAGFILKCHL